MKDVTISMWSLECNSNNSTIMVVILAFAHVQIVYTEILARTIIYEYIEKYRKQNFHSFLNSQVIESVIF